MRWQKWALAILGISIILISVVLILYAFWPLPETIEAVPLAPTLFAPPS
ncbi:MAG: hypothetical protein R3335_03460 [Anaerolineales bacterium]|nr:hypothetical protein [Anaerolineales bacterium]